MSLASVGTPLAPMVSSYELEEYIPFIISVLELEEEPSLYPSQTLDQML
jgi:hypothetical protein